MSLLRGVSVYRSSCPALLANDGGSDGQRSSNQADGDSAVRGGGHPGPRKTRRASRVATRWSNCGWCDGGRSPKSGAQDTSTTENKQHMEVPREQPTVGRRSSRLRAKKERAEGRYDPEPHVPKTQADTGPAPSGCAHIVGSGMVVVNPDGTLTSSEKRLGDMVQHLNEEK